MLSAAVVVLAAEAVVTVLVVVPAVVPLPPEDSCAMTVPVEEVAIY